MGQPLDRSPARRSSNVAFTLRAFRYRNCRLFFGGQVVSLIGTWVTTTATAWVDADRRRRHSPRRPPHLRPADTASGLGALLGAIWLASQRSVIGLSRVIPIAAGLFGFGLIGFSASRHLWLSLAFPVITGFGLMVQAASRDTVMQTIVPDEKRGRIMSFSSRPTLAPHLSAASSPER